MKSKSWNRFQFIQFILYLCVSIFLFMRSVDGAGAVQTPMIKMISFAVWTVFYVFVLAIEWGIHLITHRKR